jgi:hypothetical protein
MAKAPFVAFFQFWILIGVINEIIVGPFRAAIGAPHDIGDVEVGLEHFKRVATGTDVELVRAQRVDRGVDAVIDDSPVLFAKGKLLGVRPTSLEYDVSQGVHRAVVVCCQAADYCG